MHPLAAWRLALAAAALGLTAGTSAQLVIEDEDGGAGGGLVIEDDSSQGSGLVIEDDSEAGSGLVIEDDSDSGGLVIEDDDATASAPTADDLDAWAFGLERLRAEAGLFPHRRSQSSISTHLGGELVVNYRPRNAADAPFRVDGRAGLRFDHDGQYGSVDETGNVLDYGDTWLRFRRGDARLTIGAQTVMWGRVDEVPPQDRLSVQDITRYALDPLEDRRRSTPTLRFEYSPGPFKADFLLVPWFRPAQLPEPDSVWSPVNRHRGRIIGVDGRDQPGFDTLVENASVGGFEDYESFGGAGLRLTYAGSGYDVGVSAQRARSSLPYYQFNPTVLAALSQPLPPGVTPEQGLEFALAQDGGKPTLIEVHPLGWVLGADISFVWKNATWRVEGAWSDDVPVTDERLRLKHVRAADWVAAVEFYPGDADTRVNLQLVGRHLLGADDVIDKEDTLLINGELDVPFDQSRWNFRTRFNVGLSQRDFYVNPQLSFKGFEPHEFYIGAHLFAGSESSPNGFFADEDLIVVGWQAQF